MFDHAGDLATFGSGSDLPREDARGDQCDLVGLVAAQPEGSLCGHEAVVPGVAADGHDGQSIGCGKFVPGVAGAGHARQQFFERAEIEKVAAAQGALHEFAASVRRRETFAIGFAQGIDLLPVWIRKPQEDRLHEDDFGAHIGDDAPGGDRVAPSPGDQDLGPELMAVARVEQMQIEHPHTEHREARQR